MLSVMYKRNKRIFRNKLGSNMVLLVRQKVKKISCAPWNVCGTSEGRVSEVMPLQRQLVSQLANNGTTLTQLYLTFPDSLLAVTYIHSILLPTPLYFSNDPNIYPPNFVRTHQHVSSIWCSDRLSRTSTNLNYC